MHEAEFHTLSLLFHSDKRQEKIVSHGIEADLFEDEFAREFFIHLTKFPNEATTDDLIRETICNSKFGAEFLAKLMCEGALTLNIGYYVNQLKVKRANNELKKFSRLAITIADDESLTADEKSSRIQEVTTSMNHIVSALGVEDDSTQSLLYKTIEYLQDKAQIILNGGKVGLTTGIATLDAWLNGGWMPNSMYTVAGKSGGGKTTFAISAAAAALRQNKCVVYFTVEMSPEQITTKLLSSLAGIESSPLFSGTASETAYDQLISATRSMTSKRWHVYDMKTQSFDLLMQIANAASVAKKPDLYVVDYIQQFELADKDKNMTRAEEIKKMCARLKTFAMSTKATVLLLAQFNREAYKGPPEMHHVGDSSAIVNFSDCCLLLNRDYDINKAGERHEVPEGHMQLRIRKNRWGASDNLMVRCNLSKNNFWSDEKVN